MAILMLLIAMSTGQTTPTPTGMVTGSVYDGECDTPLQWAAVVLEGTTQGAMTDENGMFEIPDVQPGAYTLKAMMMGYRTRQIEIEVIPVRETNVRFDLQEYAITNAVGSSEGRSKLCEVHELHMNLVLVPIGYGLHMVDGNYERVRLARFPHAEPWSHDGCVPHEPVKRWDFRCSECISSRNGFESKAQWPAERRTLPQDWQLYTFGDLLSLFAPAGGQQESDKSGCVTTYHWESNTFVMELLHGPRARGLGYGYHDAKYNVAEVIDSMYVGLSVFENKYKDGFGTVVARFCAVPNDTRWITVAVHYEGYDQIEGAAAILRSIRLKRPN